MSHAIEVFIFREEMSAAVAAEIPGAAIVPLERGCCLMPVTDEIVESLCRQSSDLAGRTFKGFSKLSEAIARAAERLSRHGVIAYVETDYFGGIGGQSAAVWEQGRLSLSDTTDDVGPINAALKLLGVEGSFARDEFDTIGLGRKRSNEAWLSEKG